MSDKENLLLIFAKAKQTFRVNSGGDIELYLGERDHEAIWIKFDFNEAEDLGDVKLTIS